MHLQLAMNRGDYRRLQEITGVLGGGRSRGGQWEVRQVLRLYSSVR